MTLLTGMRLQVLIKSHGLHGVHRLNSVKICDICEIYSNDN